MEGIISKTQNAFIRGRPILDFFLITNECITSRIKSVESGMLCKFDLEKAYDYISWDFLLYMLRQCGFGKKWQSWIVHCITTVRLFILINNISDDFFNSSHGLGAALFIRTTFLGKNQTMDNLRKHHIIVIDWFCM